jgi:hypothetical protein
MRARLIPGCVSQAATNSAPSNDAAIVPTSWGPHATRLELWYVPTLNGVASTRAPVELTRSARRLAWVPEISSQTMSQLVPSYATCGMNAC